MTDDERTTPAIEAVQAAGIDHTVTRHGRVRSLEEAAAARGIEPRDLIKTLVVRVSEGEHVFVLVPGSPDAIPGEPAERYRDGSFHALLHRA